MELSLHRELKERYGPGSGGRVEVSHDGFRIDAVTGDGVFVEIQSAALAPLRKKLQRLLIDSSVRVVKPVVVARRVIRRAFKDGADLSARFSPKRASPFDVFEDLIGIARLFPHPNLEIEILAVEVDEIRVTRKRRPGFSVHDRLLRSIVGRTTLHASSDLWDLFPKPEIWRQPFTTRELSERLERPLHFAQGVAYCLHHMGAARTVGKRGNLQVYKRCTTVDAGRDHTEFGSQVKPSAFRESERTGMKPALVAVAAHSPSIE